MWAERAAKSTNTMYVCNGRQQLLVSLCDMTNFRADQVDDTVWQWIKHVMQHPDQVANGLRAEKTEAGRANSALSERLALIDDKITENQSKLDRLLDLYLDKSISKETLLERETRLKATPADLNAERADLAEHLRTNIPTQEKNQLHCRLLRGNRRGARQRHL